MKNSTDKKTSIDTLNAYRSARLFEKASNLIERERGIKHEKLWFTPVIINSAFSLEVYLKCLIRIETGSRPIRGLTLIELFYELSEESKIAVEKYFSEKIELDLFSILNEISNTFVEWPHAYKRVSDKSFIGVGPIFYAVNRRIRELRPEWTEEVIGL